ncbi:hypothetical protein PINS_up001150 [Pythium insidiosum]|nr:hypothetical protein PINS_up001150 [Pythium insidiosum]
MLLRWLVCILALLNSYRLGVADWHNAGIGSLSCARSFNVLPLVLLPRLKFTLAAFWTVGCEFEGQQKALSEAWFAIYPGIAEFMLFFYSLLNFVAKVLHRRVSDKLFGPTLLFFCLMHRFRLELAQSGWFEFDGRISTVILSSQVDELRLTDFFTTDAALRMNGNIHSMFYIKLAVLALNLLPLVLFSDDMTTRGYWYRSFGMCEVEKALAMRASYVGGIGRSRLYVRQKCLETSKPPTLIGPSLETTRTRGPEKAEKVGVIQSDGSMSTSADKRSNQTRVSLVDRVGRVLVEWMPRAPRPAKEKSEAGQDVVHDHNLVNYELIRFGYVVFGGKYLISIDDWYIVTALAPMRMLEKLWNHRIIAFSVTKAGDQFRVSEKAQLLRLDDQELLSVSWYDVVACAFQ